jgi:hypothetical protein
MKGRKEDVMIDRHLAIIFTDIFCFTNELYDFTRSLTNKWQKMKKECLNMFYCATHYELKKKIKINSFMSSGRSMK